MNHRNSVLPFLLQTVFALTLACVATAPVFGAIPPEHRADFFSVTYPEQSLTYYYSLQPDGSYSYTSSDGSITGELDSGTLDQVGIEHLVTGENGEFHSLVTVPDGLGGSIGYETYGTWDESSGVADGTLVLPDGQLRAVSVYLPSFQSSPSVGGAGGELRSLDESLVVIVVVGTAGAAIAASAAACFIRTLWTNCVKDCKVACAASGGTVKSATEGWCGSCTCECNKPCAGAKSGFGGVEAYATCSPTPTPTASPSPTATYTPYPY